MTALAATNEAPLRRLAAWLHERPRLRLALLLAAPVGWLVVMYLGALGVLFLNSIWLRDQFTGLVSRTLTLDNFVEIATNPVYRTVMLRTSTGPLVYGAVRLTNSTPDSRAARMISR